MKKLSADRLREVLHYCPDTGVFTWATKTNKRIVVGAEAAIDGVLRHILPQLDRETADRLLEQIVLGWG